MAVNRDHFAIVVGLSGYPRLGDPPPSNLAGPGNDADAVYEWLVAEDGGGLPKENIKLIKTPKKMTKAGAPDRDTIQAAFADLETRAEEGRTGLGALLGERLYVYAAGHGFSPKLDEGCLHAGNATSDSSGLNVFFTAWLNLFQEAGYFTETVLWMDCCMNRDSKNAASLPTMQAKVSPDPPGPRFIAFAARRPLRAVERLGPDGKVHGVFTTILLEGLRGAAANPYGKVTGRSLADWLRNAQHGRLEEADLNDPRVSKAPEIIREDQELIFARELPPATYPVKLQFDDGAGREAKLWSLRPPRPEKLHIGPTGEIDVRLGPGLYLVELPSKKLRQGFQVSAPLTLKIDRPGKPVNSVDALVPFSIDPHDPAAEIFIVDEAFNLVDRGVGSLNVKLPMGLYKVRIRSGTRISDEVHLLDAPVDPEHAAAPLAPFSAAAPLPHSALTHEYHMAARAEAAQRVDLKKGTDGKLMVMTRIWRKDDAPPAELLPWEGMKVLNRSGKVIADLAQDGERKTDQDVFATVTIELDPGTYFLRMPDLAGGQREQSVVVSPNWRTESYVLFTPRNVDQEGFVGPRIAILMHGIDMPVGDDSDLVINQAQVALANERLVLGGELDDLLISKFSNPIAGIIGGHLLIVEHSHRPSNRILQLDEVVRNLRGLVGDRHPDVEALSLHCSDKALRNRNPVGEPPMFQASWELLVEASRQRPDQIPPDLWNRVLASAPVPPFFGWSVDARSRKFSRESILANLMPQAETAAAAAVAAAVGGAMPAGLVIAEAVPMRVDHGPAAAQAAASSASLSRRTKRGRELDARLKALGLPPSALGVLDML